MAIAIYQVDVFTKEAFKGNPAVVCFLKTTVTDEWMKQVAMEMNAPETVFVMKENDGFRLRWYSGEIEVELCGHSTLAAAHTLWEENMLLENEVAKFYTASGILTAAKFGSLIELNFPRNEIREVEPPSELIKAFGHLAFNYVGKDDNDYLLEVESEQVIASLTPNFELLKAIEARGFIVTSCSSSDGYDFVSRFFAPRLGVNEDQATGSAHSSLAMHWQSRLNKNELLAYQASKRGGTIHIRIEKNRVVLGGECVTIFKGELLK